VLFRLFFTSGPSTAEEVDDAFAIFLMMFRYGTQILRLLLLIKNQQQKLTNCSNTNLVDLSSVQFNGEEDHFTNGSASREGSMNHDSFALQPGSEDEEEENRDYHENSVKLRFDPLNQRL